MAAMAVYGRIVIRKHQAGQLAKIYHSHPAQTPRDPCSGLQAVPC